ncbi:MAG: hypothetical protein ACHQ03_04530 [Candidatus Bathyarchaeia archaeon]
MRRHGSVDDKKITRAIVWTYYYLGICDGLSASLETLRSLNPEPLKDAEWRNKWRGYLPPQLAALRHPHADDAAAAEIIIQEFKLGLHLDKDQTSKRVNSS